MPRIHGRTIRPSNLAERRVLLSIGVDCLRVPRSENPFVAMRMLKRLASSNTPDILGLRKMIEIDRERRPSLPMPPAELPYSTTESDAHASAA